MNIIINGVPRSGTTITFNLCREISKIVDGDHTVEHGGHIRQSKMSLDRCHLVTVFRNPIYCLSSMQTVGFIQKNSINWDSIIRLYQICIENMNMSKDTVFAYEKYLPDNNKSLIRLLSKRIFNTVLSTNDVNQISNKFSINTVKKSIDKLKTFGQQDMKSLFHGNHITTDGMGSSSIMQEDYIKKEVEQFLKTNIVREYIRIHTLLYRPVNYTIPQFI